MMRWLVGLVLFTLVALAGTWLVRGLMEPVTMPVKQVTVRGAFRYLDRESLRERIESGIQYGAVISDTAQLRESVEELAWVRTATVRKYWPHRLELQVTEEDPIALYGDDEVVVQEGRLINPGRDHRPVGLPRFAGPRDRLRDIAQFHQLMQERLGALHLRVNELTLTAVGNWSFQLEGGPRVLLGSRQPEQMLQRFIEAYPALTTIGAMESIDLRYAQGLAVRFPPVTPSPKDLSKSPLKNTERSG